MQSQHRLERFPARRILLADERRAEAARRQEPANGDDGEAQRDEPEVTGSEEVRQYDRAGEPETADEQASRAHGRNAGDRAAAYGVCGQALLLDRRLVLHRGLRY